MDSNKDRFGRGFGLHRGEQKTHYNEPEIKSLVEGKVGEILNLRDESVEEFIKTAEECAKRFAGKDKDSDRYIGGDIPSSKIRQFYDYVKSMDKFDKVKLHLLKPKIAYAVGRETNKNKQDALKIFQKTMEDLINQINDDNQFNNFVKFFEAIIAYHKIYENKKNEPKR